MSQQFAVASCLSVTFVMSVGSRLFPSQSLLTWGIPLASSDSKYSSHGVDYSLVTHARSTMLCWPWPPYLTFKVYGFGSIIVGTPSRDLHWEDNAR